MGLSVDTLITKTRAYINEYVATDDDFKTETDELLKEYVDSAARMVAMVAPSNMQVTKANQSLSTTWTERSDGNYVGRASLPPDYLRLERLDCKNASGSIASKRTVTLLLAIQHPSYVQQNSYVKGIGSGQYAPSAYLNDGVVEYHSLPEYKDDKKDAANLIISYVQIPKNENGTYASLDEHLMEPVAWQAASLYLSMTGSQYATIAQTTAQAMLQNAIAEESNQQ